MNMKIAFQTAVKQLKIHSVYKRSFGLFVCLLAFSATGLSSSAPATAFSVYFTKASPGNRTGTGPATALVHLINNAKRSVHGSFYELTSRKIINALLDARKRGVDIKLVLESDNFHEPEVYPLLKAHVPVVTDQRGGLMHNKFVIIDDSIVWTGSFNATENGSRNNNNGIAIHSLKCAALYRNEFNEQFTYRVFGNKKNYGPFADFLNKNRLVIGDSRVTVCFSPDDPVEDVLLHFIRQATETVDFMAFSFTSDRLGELLIKKHKAGIAVRGLVERKGTGSEFSQFVKMRLEGVPVRTDRNRYVMHHKVIIIDKKIVITGSYNFSKNASLVNDENIIAIENSQLAAQYLAEFERLY